MYLNYIASSIYAVKKQKIDYSIIKKEFTTDDKIQIKFLKTIKRCTLVILNTEVQL